jgi:hypothetical protein
LPRGVRLVDVGQSLRRLVYYANDSVRLHFHKVDFLIVVRKVDNHVDGLGRDGAPFLRLPLGLRLRNHCLYPILFSWILMTDLIEEVAVDHLRRRKIAAGH